MAPRKIMKKRVLAILAIAIIAPCNSIPDDVDDFNKVSSGICQNCEDNNIKDESRPKTNLDNPPFISSFLHQGNNLFFKPQILLGSTVNNPYVTEKPEDDNEREVEPVLPTVIVTKNDTSIRQEKVILSNIPAPPVLPPLEMPKLPETVIIEEPIVYTSYNVPVQIEEVLLKTKDETVIVHEPSLEIIKPPQITTEVTFPKLFPRVPTCLIDAVNVYGITVPCPPTVAFPPEIISVEKINKTPLIVPPSPILTLPLPKIPLEPIFNRPIKTLVPYAEDFISTTRFLPSVRGSKLETFNRREQLHFSKPLRPRLFGERNRRNRVKIVEERVQRLSSFSAYIAHNIALERVLPNIVTGAIINPPLQPILEFPVY